jgi:PAN domain
LMNIVGLETDWLNVSGPRFEVENFRTLSQDGSVVGQPLGPFTLRGFALNQDTDVMGNDLLAKGIRPVEVQQCFNLCAFNSTCVAFSFVAAKNWCWLKGSYLGSRTMQGVVSYKLTE